jgi:hypothetical protein
MKSMSSATTSFPRYPCKLSRRAVQEGSTPVDVNPESALYPICATWTKAPSLGCEIIDLLMLPPPLEMDFFRDGRFNFAGTVAIKT